MLSAKLVFIIAVWWCVLNLGYIGGEEGSDDMVRTPPANCLNCTICEYPCHPLPQPSPQLPGYGAPPPPLPSMELAPPQPPKHSSQGKCPPASATPCCQYGRYPPPHIYDGFVPYGNNLSDSSPLSFFLSVVVLLFSSFVLL